MPAWSEVSAAAPELAAAVKARFAATGLGLIATLRRDGSPRLSGVEPLFALGEVWLGMMPGSLKARDLLRDPRFALHAATVDKNVAEGDAKIGGRALVVVNHDEMARFADAFKAETGYDPGSGPFHLFRADVSEVSMLRPGGDHLAIEWWREGEGAKRVERR